MPLFSCQGRNLTKVKFWYSIYTALENRPQVWPYGRAFSNPMTSASKKGIIESIGKTGAFFITFGVVFVLMLPSWALWTPSQNFHIPRRTEYP
jgi:hypothetical protein